MPETKDLLLKKARFEDWEELYRSAWSREETARYMLWKVTETEEEARSRMERTLRFQSEHDAWTVYEKKSGKAIGWGGMLPMESGVYEDCGIAVGPEFVGRGYGKQILGALTDYAFDELNARAFVVSCRRENAASRGMILSCGFHFTHTEEREDPRGGGTYTLEFYRREKEERKCFFLKRSGFACAPCLRKTRK